MTNIVVLYLSYLYLMLLDLVQQLDLDSQSTKKQLEQKKLNLREAGIIVPDNFDDNLLAKITGMGSTVSSPSKEMEAINGANFLMNNDPNGAKWIKSNKIEGANQGARGRREGRRRR